MKTLLEKILAILARATLRRYKPIVIGITGSVGKTSAKEAVFAVLKLKRSVRTSESNYNNEIGVPLTILGISHYGRNIFLWAGAFVRVLFRVVVRDQNFPKILILEMGADRPGDIAYLANLAKPTIGIITSVGEIPVHVEFFSGPEDVAREKAKLIQSLPIDGLAILNADDDILTDIRKETKAHVQTFGFDEHADMRIADVRLATDFNKELNQEIPEGIVFTLSYKHKIAPVKLNGVFGKPQAYAAAAAALVGTRFGMTLPEIAAALSLYVPPPGRLRLLKGIKHTWILDDSYNSSPQALHSALDTLRDLPGKRKIAILGDMLELGEYTEAAHRTAGDRVAEFVDVLITVGPRAKFIAEEAQSGGLENVKVLQPNQVHSFDIAAQALPILDGIIREGDLILVKGSQGMRMEKITEEIMAEPERASELLVRQSEYWKKR